MVHNKVIQEVVAPEVFKLNHAATNKKQGDQMQFYLEKRLEKSKCFSCNKEKNRAEMA